MEWNSFSWGICTGSAVWVAIMLHIFTKIRSMIDSTHKELDRVENERRELHKIIRAWSDKK